MSDHPQTQSCPLLLDGATGTELDRRGVDVTLPLWSARAMIDAPDILRAIHVDYLRAGAQAITTNTFRTHGRSLSHAGMEDRAESFTRVAVDIARDARDSVSPDARVFGSVAPLEDCYSPHLSPDADTCSIEHGHHIDHLLSAGVDLVLIETMCAAHESIAAAQAARDRAPGNWAISFCLRSEGPPGVMLDGTPIIDLLPRLQGACFIGVNCVAAPDLAGQIAHLRAVSGPEVDIAAWGNIGHPDSATGWVNTDAIDPDRCADYAQEWLDAGASVIGGCCGTTPDTTRAMRRRLGLP